MKMRNKLLYIIESIVLLMLMSSLVNGYQFIQNPKFLNHTSITDIQNWYVIDYDYDNLIDPSTYYDWELVSRQDLLGQSIAGYFITVDY